MGGHGCFCSFAGRGGPRFHHCQSCHASRDWRSRGSPKRLALGATKGLLNQSNTSFFKVTFWFPKSRSLKPCKGHLWDETRSLWRTWYRDSILDATRSILLCCTLSKLIVESDRVIIIHLFEWPKGNHSWVGCKLNPCCACIVSPCCT